MVFNRKCDFWAGHARLLALDGKKQIDARIPLFTSVMPDDNITWCSTDLEYHITPETVATEAEK